MLNNNLNFERFLFGFFNNKRFLKEAETQTHKYLEEGGKHFEHVLK